VRTVDTAPEHLAFVGFFLDAQAAISVDALPIACEPSRIEGVRLAIEIE
jgi:hypothetical protein